MSRFNTFWETTCQNENNRTDWVRKRCLTGEANNIVSHFHFKFPFYVLKKLNVVAMILNGLNILEQ